jgi:hypothetical protein
MFRVAITVLGKCFAIHTMAPPSRLHAKLREAEQEQAELERQLVMVKFRKQRVWNQINSPRAPRNPWASSSARCPAPPPMPPPPHLRPSRWGPQDPGCEYEDDGDFDDDADGNDCVEESDDDLPVPPPPPKRAKKLQKQAPKATTTTRPKDESNDDEFEEWLQTEAEKRAKLPVGEWSNRKYLEVEKIKMIYTACGAWRQKLPGLCQTPGCTKTQHSTRGFSGHCCERCWTDHAAEEFSKKRASTEIPHGKACEGQEFF